MVINRLPGDVLLCTNQPQQCNCSLKQLTRPIGMQSIANVPPPGVAWLLQMPVDASMTRIDLHCLTLQACGVGNEGHNILQTVCLRPNNTQSQLGTFQPCLPSDPLHSPRAAHLPSQWQSSGLLLLSFVRPSQQDIHPALCSSYSSMQTLQMDPACELYVMPKQGWITAHPPYKPRLCSLPISEPSLPHLTKESNM